MGRDIPPRLTRAHAAAVAAELRKLTPVQRRRLRSAGYVAVTRDWRFWAGGLSPLATIVALGLAGHLHGAKLIIGVVIGAEALSLGGLLFAIWTIRSVGLRVMSLQFPNLCKTCGYDLTGNTTGVCPECGNPIGATAH